MGVRATLADAAQRAYQTITRGTLVKATDDTKWQTVEVKGMYGETIKGVEVAHPYGFTSHPKPPTGEEQAEVILFSLSGDRSHTVAMPVGDRRHRPKDMAEGEVGLHDDQQQKLTLKRDGLIIDVPSGKKVTLKQGAATVTMDGENVTVVPGAGGKVYMG